MKKLFFRIFLIGIFLLPSAPSISIIFLLISGIYASFQKEVFYFKDKWNIPFFFAGILLILSCITNTVSAESIYSFPYDIRLTWIGLFNWIPYFWSFWAFQYFLKEYIQRKTFALVLLSGSVPILITGILQYFFKISGPYSLFNGFLTWYMRPIIGYNGLTGIFSNANYAGTWLNIMLPFTIAILFKNGKSLFFKYSSFLFFGVVIICTFLTFSRNSWLSMCIGLFITFGFRSIKFIIPFIGVFFSTIYFFGTKVWVTELQSFWSYKFKNFQSIENLASAIRVDIWNFAITNIFKRPTWGWGSTAFSNMFEIERGSWMGHVHNLPLELAFRYGIPVCLIIFSAITFLLIKSLKEIRAKKSILVYKFELAWWCATLLILSNQMFDVQYYDLRIGLVFWILLGGLRNTLLR